MSSSAPGVKNNDDVFDQDNVENGPGSSGSKSNSFELKEQSHFPDRSFSIAPSRGRNREVPVVIISESGETKCISN